jgi:hypothetical protein
VDPALRDTDLALHMTASLRPTERHLEAPDIAQPEPSIEPSAEPATTGPPGLGLLLFALGAALLGVALGILMSFVGAL